MPGGLPVDDRGWEVFFAAFRRVVLVANSEAVDIEDLTRRFGQASLFVFFNKTYKVLDRPFEKPSLLVARSSEAGANIVYRREVEEVLRPFAGAQFHGILNLRAGTGEKFSRADEFAGRPVGFLDLSAAFAGAYPSARLPTTGFALAVWLAERRFSATIHLAGFSARRSERWKLFRDHDWTFEQTVLRLLHRAGRLELVDARDTAKPLANLVGRFPEIASADVARTAVEVLTERLESTDAAVDRLFSLTRWQGRIDSALRSLKPRTRKQKLATGGDGRTDSLAKKPGGD
ncbi:MAG: 3-deoxy-manno-octulosonate cytidylyltransferase [Methylobacterium mesophilicum]|nr:3-deoxy-manno-octulosonate cytidylyltransferase [Methylobacterium mesophilicum]